MTHEEILAMLGDYVDYLIANSSAEAPMWNIEKVRSGKPNKWNYIDGCMITACLSLSFTRLAWEILSASRPSMVLIPGICWIRSWRRCPRRRWRYWRRSCPVSRL